MAALGTDSPTPSFRLRYSAPGACPTREQFVESILARAPTVRESDASDATLDLQVVLEEQQGATVGTLSVQRGGVVSSREVPAAPCAEVADSLALMIALMLDSPSEAEVAVEPSNSSGAVAQVNADSAMAAHQDAPAVSSTNVAAKLVSELAERYLQRLGNDLHTAHLRELLRAAASR